MSNDQFADAVALVADTSTPVAMLRILSSTHPALRAQIALHPNADAALLEKLADDPDPAVKASVSVAQQRTPQPAAQPAPVRPDFAAKASADTVPPPPAPEEFVIAVSRGTRCGKCGAYLFRAPNQASKACPSCGVVNKASTDTPLYGAPYGMAAGYTAVAAPQMRTTDGNIFGEVALILAILAVISFIISAGAHVSAFSWIYLLASIGALVFGALGIRAAGRGEAENKGLAITGLVIGIVGCTFFLLGVTLLGLLLAALA